ncbi:flagellar hook-basal body complex protein FliE [Alicyclobacillus ferrooxydans]|nr:flagellar hook-basal body complex protein FliE [Alicyclobacillus ferrooxydans]
MISGIQFTPSTMNSAVSANSRGNQSVSGGQDFGSLLQGALNNVGNTLSQANTDAVMYATGGPVSIQQLMVAEQQANIAADTITQVDKRIVSDYQTIMNMSV